MRTLNGGLARLGATELVTLGRAPRPSADDPERFRDPATEAAELRRLRDAIEREVNVIERRINQEDGTDDAPPLGQDGALVMGEPTPLPQPSNGLAQAGDLGH